MRLKGHLFTPKGPARCLPCHHPTRPSRIAVSVSASTGRHSPGSTLRDVIAVHNIFPVTRVGAADHGKGLREKGAADSRTHRLLVPTTPEPSDTAGAVALVLKRIFGIRVVFAGVVGVGIVRLLGLVVLVVVADDRRESGAGGIGAQAPAVNPRRVPVCHAGCAENPGHASAAMTLDVYADLFESDLDAVADRLEIVLTSCSPGAQSHARSTPKTGSASVNGNHQSARPRLPGR